MKCEYILNILISTGLNETKLLLITNTIYRKIEKSQSSFTWWSMKRDCNAYAHVAVNAPFMRMVVYGNFSSVHPDVPIWLSY